MQRLVLWFSDGTIIFPGLILFFMASLGLRHKTRGIQGLSRIGWVAGFLLVTLSAAPLPVWMYILWTALGMLTALKNPRFRNLSFAGLLGISVWMGGAEWRTRAYPLVGLEIDQPIYVIGDSMTSSVATRYICWPEIVAEAKEVHAFNLAHPGATTADAMQQAKKIPLDKPGLVLIEIGGNDMIGFTASSEFAIDLDHLLKELSAGQHKLVLFELPLFPTKNGYGQVQRNLAQKYNVTLIPKTFLAGVLAVENSTEDGLHLSQLGHEVFADRLLKHVLR